MLSNLVLLLLQLQLPPLEVGELELLLGGHHLGRGGVGMLLLLELLLLPQLLLHLSLLLLELSFEALLLLFRCTACLKKYHHSRLKNFPFPKVHFVYLVDMEAAEGREPAGNGEKKRN